MMKCTFDPTSLSKDGFVHFIQLLIQVCTFDPTSLSKDGFGQGKKDSDRRWTNNQRERVRKYISNLRKKCIHKYSCIYVYIHMWKECIFLLLVINTFFNTVPFLSLK